MKPYTVLLLRPDYIAEPYGQDTYLAHVDANNPDEAVVAGQMRVWNEDHGDDAGSSWDDYHPLLVLDGHLYDASPLPHTPELLNAVQAAVTQHYEGGEFEDFPDLKECGDGLFTFLINEAGDASGPEEFMGMLSTALMQLQRLETDLMCHYGDLNV